MAVSALEAYKISIVLKGVSYNIYKGAYGDLGLQPQCR